jgi:excisionase family DNA binding protein
MQRELLTTREVAALLGYHPNSIYALCAAGKLPHVKLGRDLRFPRQKIMAMIEGRPVGEITVGEAV